MTLCKTICILSVLLSLAIPASAEYDPGLIKADSPLWKVDLALEGIHEKLTLNNEKLIKLQLKHSNERLGELQQTSDIEAVTNEYNAVLARIQANHRVNYASTEAIQTTMEEHNRFFSTLNPADDEMRLAVVRASFNNTELRVQNYNHQRDIADTDMKWWGSFSSKYQVTRLDTSVFHITDEITMNDVHVFVPEGITQVTITQSNGDVVQEYIIKHTDDDILICIGTTTNPDQSMTLTIEDVKNAVERFS